MMIFFGWRYDDAQTHTCHLVALQKIFVRSSRQDERMVKNITKNERNNVNSKRTHDRES